MPTEAALEATVTTKRGMQQERLDHDDHESMSSKSAAELAASAAQLRQLMQQLLDSRFPQQQRQQLLPELQSLPQQPSMPDQQHQTYQVHPDVVLGEQLHQQRLQEQESLQSFGSSFSLQTANNVAATAAASQAPPEMSVPQTTSAVTKAGGLPAQTNPAAEAAPMAAAEQENKTNNGLHSLAIHARDLLQEIEAAAASSPATTVVSRVASPTSLQQQQQQHQGQTEHAQEVPQQQLPFTRQHKDTPATSSSPTGYAAEAAASSIDDSLTWSTALQRYQLHTQHQQLQLQQQQQQQQQPHAMDEHHADNWSSSYLANSPSPEGFGGLYPPYSTAAPAAAPLLEQGTAMQLEPCAAAAAVAARMTAVSSLTSAAEPVLLADQRWEQHSQQQHDYGSIRKADAMSMDAGGSVSVNVPGGLAAAAAGSVHGSSVFGGCDATGAAAAAHQLDPGLRLRVRSLRGPLEDAMRCYAELQEVKEESSLLRATNARLTAAAQDAESERAYLLAERALVVTQLRNMAAMLAADERVVAAGSSGGAAAAAAAATRLSSAGRPDCNGASGAARAHGLLGMYSGGDTTGPATLTAERDAEAQLETAWRLLAPSSSLRFSCNPSQIPHDVAAVAHELQAAVDRKQQLVLQLQEQLGRQAVDLQQAQQAAEVLQQRLAAAGNAAELTVGQVALKLEAKWGKRVIKAEQKTAALAQEHQSAVTELQQQLRRTEQALTQAQQTAEQHADDKARLAGRLTALEAEKEALLEQIEGQRAAKSTVEEQVASLQQEQQQLLVALAALEGSLLEARQSTEDQRAAVARLEDAMQRKNIAAVEMRQQLREARQQAQQAASEIQQLQQQLGALRSKAADSARQLSAARTSAKEASEALATEQARAQQQMALLDDLRAELDKSRRASAAAQKAQATEAKRAAAADAVITSLRQELSAAKEAAADAAVATEAAAVEQHKLLQQKQQTQQEAQRLQQQVEQLSQTNQRLVQQRQQLQRQLSEYEESLAAYERSLAAAVRRAESADAELAGIRQEVAEWASFRDLESFKLQETRQKLAAAETDLGVALQRVAACGMQTRLGAGSRPASACIARRPAGSAERPAGGGLAGGHNCSYSAQGSPAAAGGPLLQQQQQQHLPVEVTRQLQWQAEEVLRLTGQLYQVQAQFRHAEQQLMECQQQLAHTQQQLAAAEDAVRWQQQQQQQQHFKPQIEQQQQQQRPNELQRQDDSAEVQQLQKQLQQLQQSSALAEAHVAELTSALAAAKSELVQQQREHHLKMRQMQEDLAAATAEAVEARQQLQDQRWKQQDQQQQLSMDRLQQLEAAGLLLRQAQVSSSGSEDSSSDSDAGSDCQCFQTGDLVAAAAVDMRHAAELALHNQQGIMKLPGEQQQQVQDQHTAEQVPQEGSRGGRKQARRGACPAAVEAEQLAEAAAAYVAETQGALCENSSSSIGDTGQDSSHGRKGSGSRKSKGTCMSIHAAQHCSTIDSAAASYGADGHAVVNCSTPSPHPQMQQQQQQLLGVKEWKQQLQQQVLQAQQQLLQQAQWQSTEQQPQHPKHNNLGSQGAQHCSESAVAGQLCHNVTRGSSACARRSSNNHSACSAMQPAAVPASSGLSSTVLQQKQQRHNITGPPTCCDSIAEDTSSQLWEVASSSCDFEGALAAAAAALQAAS